MSSKFRVSEYQKELEEKYRMSMNKENVYSVQNGKLEGKSEGKRKGLSWNAENRVVRRTTSMQNFFVGQPKFQIYHDGNDENVRSRPRVRKDVCRKEIRARGSEQAQTENPNNKKPEKTIVSTTEAAAVKIDSDLHTVSRR